MLMLTFVWHHSTKQRLTVMRRIVFPFNCKSCSVCCSCPPSAPSRRRWDTPLPRLWLEDVCMLLRCGCRVLRRFATFVSGCLFARWFVCLVGADQ